MPGPCGAGWNTMDVHEKAKCAERSRCTGPGCRVYRPERVKPLPAES